MAPVESSFRVKVARTGQLAGGVNGQHDERTNRGSELGDTPDVPAKANDRDCVIVTGARLTMR